METDTIILSVGEIISFAKFDAGNPIPAEGILEEITDDFIRVSHSDEKGKHICKFRRSFGKTSGWGIGPCKFWRLSAESRKKFCHPDTSNKR